MIVGRLIEGYDYYGSRLAPRVDVVSMYTDQTPENDLSRPMAARHGFRICPTVHDALTLGTRRLAVEGVVLIGEHGKYPLNEKGQQLYPRYELFKQIEDVFRASRRAVPVYSDKHFSVDWEKAKWMYDQSRELGFPLMAGSSKPVGWRKPPLELELETAVTRSVAFYYGPKEAYGFHALEVNQCMVERREGGETGIAAVQCLEGPAVWEWTEDTPWAPQLLEAALARSETRKQAKVSDLVQKPIAFHLEYRSGLESAVYLLNGFVEDSAFSRTDSADSVRAYYGEPSHISKAKQLDHLDQHCKTFIELSPFVVVATVDTGGRVGASPRGDAPGFVGRTR